MRLWPQVTGEAIEHETTNKRLVIGNISANSPITNHQSSTHQYELERLVEQQKQTISTQAQIIELLKIQIGKLSEDKSMLIRQIDSLREDYRAFTRLLPQSASPNVKKVVTGTPAPARDEHGRFVHKGAATLFEGNR